MLAHYIISISMFSAGKKYVFLIGSNQFKAQILASSQDFREKNYDNSVDCFSLYQMPPY